MALKTLYKFFLKAIVQSDAFFEQFVDRREFLNRLVLQPLIDIGESLKSPSSDSQGDTLKKVRTLLTIVLTWTAKTALIRNGHVYTLNILDNELIVKMI